MPAIIFGDSGSIVGEHLELINSAATGGAEFLAINSIDGGGNSGWLFVAPTPAPGVMGSALLVVGTPALTEGDLRLQEWLESEGWSVTLRNDDEEPSRDWAIVVLAPSVAHQRIGRKYYGGADPVLILDRGVWSSWGLASDTAFAAVDTNITVSHPDLAGGTYGDVVFCAEPIAIYSAVGLSAVAIPFAYYSDGPGADSVCGFAYEDGDVTASTTAFGRRAGLGFGEEAFAAGLTEDGEAVLRGAIDWCAGVTHPQTVRVDPAPLGILAFDAGSTFSGWGVQAP